MRFETLTIGTTKLPWPAVAAALVVMPLLAMGGLRMLKRNPAAAFGGEIPSATPFTPKAESKASANALALVSQFNAEASRGFGPSPMINRAPAPPKVQPKPEVPTVKTQEPQVPAHTTTHQQVVAPDLQISSIMAARGGSVAVINGKLRRIGDAVGNGFKVSSINAGTGEVEIAHPSGETAVFHLNKQPDQ
jgi:hypothetical protein